MNQPAPPQSPMADMTVPVAKAAAIIAGAQLGVFRALADGPCTAAQLARRLGVDEHGITRLAEMLRAAGYLDKTDTRYGNGPVARAWLTAGSPVDLTPALLWSAEVWRFLEDLAASIRHGGPRQTMYQLMDTDPDKGRAFAQYMKAAAQLTTPAIVDAVRLPSGARRLLDLGGSHGVFSAAFCRRYPGLTATVFDHPVALAETEQTIAAQHLTERVKIRAGDYFTDDIGRDWDAVLCFNLIHNHHETQNRNLIAKTARALVRGGTVVVHDFLQGDPPDPFHAAFGLIMFNQNGTRVYSYEEVAGWLGDAGFRDAQRVDLPPAGLSSVVTAVRAER